MKYYIKPILKSITINTKSIMAASPGFGDGEAEGGDAKDSRGIFDYSE